MKRIIFILAFVFVCYLIPGVSAQTTAVTSNRAEMSPAEKRRAAFEMVWNTVNDNHYDPTFGGIDWKSVRTKYEPQAYAAKTDDELYRILRQMLGELKLSHFGIFAEDPNFSSAARGSGTVGVEIKMIGGEPVVFRVSDGSSASASKVRPGMKVRAVDGKSVASILKPLEDAMKGRQLTEASKNVYRERTIEAAIEGEPDSTVRLELAVRSASSVHDLRRVKFSGEMSQPMGNFPAQEVVFESKRLDGNIGYIRFSMWVIPQMTKIRAAMREFSDAAGIVVDLRGNPGGVGGMAAGFAGLLVKDRVSLGSMRSRATSLEFIVYPQTEPYLGPVVVLVDHGSGSTSEIFAAGLQEIGRAKMIGSKTAGAVLPSVFAKLPTGATFQYAISDYKSPKSVLIEGRGVFPDETVELDPNLLLDGVDTQLRRAMDIINNKKGDQ